MQHDIKKGIAILLTVALIIVLSLIALGGYHKEKAKEAKETEVQQTETIVTPDEQQVATDVADNSDADAKQTAPGDLEPDSTQDELVYEGALAGLSEEEIAKMALAEEGSAERTDEKGAEDAID